MVRSGVVAAVLVVFVVGVTACGGDDDGGEPQAVAIESAPTDDGRFELTVPESVEAGLVRLDFQNGTEEDAEAQLLRLDDGHTVEEALDGDRLRGREDPRLAPRRGRRGNDEAG